MLKADLAEIKRALTLLCEPRSIYELRLPKTSKGTVSGYYDDPDALARDAATLSGFGPGTYISLNPVNSALLARAANRFKEYATETTADRDIVVRRNLLIDADAKRPAGISATDGEHDAAIAVARQIRLYLLSLGASPDSLLLGDSGNGGHIIVRVDLLNNEPSLVLCQNFLKALAARFNTDKVEIDLKTANAARVCKIPGTLAAKGDNVPDRPHRLARIFEAPDHLTEIDRPILERIAAEAPQPPKAASGTFRSRGQPELAEDFLKRHAIPVRATEQFQGGTLFKLNMHCPFNEAHQDVAVIGWPDGRKDFKCFHNSCAEKSWAEFKALCEATPDSGKGNDPGLLEKAILAMDGVCDGAKSEDGTGFNMKDRPCMEPHIRTTKAGGRIADPMRLRVAKRLGKYAAQLSTLGININEVLAEEQRKREGDGAGDSSGLIPNLADAILADNHFAQDEGSKLYRYLDGAYKSDGSAFVKRRVKALLNEWNMTDKWRSRRADEVVEYIRVDSPKLWECPPSDTINVLNGLLKVDTCALVEHSPDFLSTIQLPVTYDPNATCAAWDKFIAEVFPEDGRQIGYEIPAYLMVAERSIQKAILLEGAGGNGKSTYLDAVRSFIGRANTASLSLQKLEADRFSAARLVSKLANICPDLPSEHLGGTSVFKAITGGDAIAAEYKFKDGFDFVPFCRLVFSANHLPRSNDSSPAFFDRWIVVPFERGFRGTGQEIPQSILMANLTSPQELSGLLNKTLSALRSIRERHGFTESASMAAAWAEFRTTTDPLAIWLDEATVEDCNAFVSRRELMLAYNTAAEQKGQPRMNETAFGLALRRLRPELKAVQRTIGGKIAWAWLGIGLRTGTEFREGDGTSRTSQGSQGFFYFIQPSANENTSPDVKDDDTGKQVKENPMNSVNPVSPDMQHEPQPSDDGWHAARDAALGMSPDDALGIWRSKGSPLIHVAPGVNVIDLERFFQAHESIEHVKAVGKWLQQRR